jgi:hypothetical protein
MIFEEMHEGLPNWGVPRFSEHGAGWLVDWYDANGNKTGASVAKGQALDWIRANPGPVATMQAEVSEWLKQIE